MTDTGCLQAAIKIAEIHAGSGSPRPAEEVLEAVFNKIKELSQTLRK